MASQHGTAVDVKTSKRVEWQLKWKERRLKRKTAKQTAGRQPVKTVTVDSKLKRASSSVKQKHNRTGDHRVRNIVRPNRVNSAGIKRRRTDDDRSSQTTKKRKQFHKVQVLCAAVSVIVISVPATDNW